MFNISHILCLSIGAIIGFFLATLCNASKRGDKSNL
ncbi:hypothetical protein SAMN05443428_1532 [Caloramator quimbayensis]|uniref:Uncharacterized protein n=1 Tax=Caloramator quimbayensis TaxID=1147123 RepID=A0A1T4YGQ9_9CLOT|nr:hypothetical protein SAMN05443428_1532 [Caloramator quimbayensis]